jgi:hypothetical protein
MAENTHREGEAAETPEEIFEGTLRAKFAANPLTPEEIEWVIRDLEKEGVKPDVNSVIRKMLKDYICSRSADHRDIDTLFNFAQGHGISYSDPEIVSAYQTFLKEDLPRRVNDTLSLIKITEKYGVPINLAAVLQAGYDALMDKHDPYCSQISFKIVDFAQERGINLKFY